MNKDEEIAGAHLIDSVNGSLHLFNYRLLSILVYQCVCVSVHVHGGQKLAAQ